MKTIQFAICVFIDSMIAVDSYITISVIHLQSTQKDYWIIQAHDRQAPALSNTVFCIITTSYTSVMDLSLRFCGGQK